MNPKVDTYLIDGCGRCAYYKTPQCKVRAWHDVIVELRNIVLECGLKEEFKWSQPCYTFNSKNVLIVSAFKEYAFISFFKGSLLNDPNRILSTPGKSSQAARQLRFTKPEEVFALEEQIKRFIQSAINIEKQGLKVQFKKNPEPVPIELLNRFKTDPKYKAAFDALSPGRQRGYVLHFSQAKQSSTRDSRIEKCRSKILKGEGLHDNYKANK